MLHDTQSAYFILLSILFPLSKRMENDANNTRITWYVYDVYEFRV